MKNITAIIECRMTSSRLPGKVLLEASGKSMLEHIVLRLSKVPKINQIVLATTVHSTDDEIEGLANSLKIPCFRGSEEDVLERVYLAARKTQTDVIVEITGDCPLIDPDIVAQTLDLYLKNVCDYACNDLKPDFPLGMDVEIFSTELLKIAHEEGELPEDREHVSWFFVRNPERFRLITLPSPPGLHRPDLRLTLDEKSDFELIKIIFEKLYSNNPHFSCRDILHFLDKNPDLLLLNRGVQQRTLSH